MEYEFDYIDGVEIPPMVFTDDHTLQSVHKGTVHVEKRDINNFWRSIRYIECT